MTWATSCLRLLDRHVEPHSRCTTAAAQALCVASAIRRKADGCRNGPTVKGGCRRRRQQNRDSGIPRGRNIFAALMDAISDPTVTRVVVAKGSQVGYTECLGNIIGFHIDQDPAPILVVQPTVEMAEAWSKDRLAPMIRDTPCLGGKVQSPLTRDSGNTLRQKVFDGGPLAIVGANSPAGLASRPVRIVVADEVDRFPVSAGSEGDPLALASKRQGTFWNRKTLVGSTPTLKETGATVSTCQRRRITSANPAARSGPIPIATTPLQKGSGWRASRTGSASPASISPACCRHGWRWPISCRSF